MESSEGRQDGVKTKRGRERIKQRKHREMKRWREWRACVDERKKVAKGGRGGGEIES